MTNPQKYVGQSDLDKIVEDIWRQADSGELVRETAWERELADTLEQRALPDGESVEETRGTP